MRRFALATLLLLILIPGAALAAVPSTMSYQGELADGAGDPVADGNYSLVFNLYDVSGGGASLWTETHAATPVTDGIFSVILGSNNPLLGLDFDKQYWLGVKVNGSAELSPRTPLAASPYALSLRVPFYGTNNSFNVPLIHLENTNASGVELQLGSPTDHGKFEAYINGANNPTVYMSPYGSHGTQLVFYDEIGDATHFIQPDGNGTGGWLSVQDGVGLGGFRVDGNSGGIGGTAVEVLGNPSSFRFDTNVGGDAATVLPSSSVSSTEMLDEPGLTQGANLSDFAVTDQVNFQDVVTTTISTPGPGYIVVSAAAQHRMSATTSGNSINIQIDETAGGSTLDDYYFTSGFSSSAPSGVFYMPVNVGRTYYKSTAGTYTFRLEAKKNTATGASGLWNASVTAVYIPTSYGTVTSGVSPGDLHAYSDLRNVIRGTNGPQAGSGTGVAVDLRELELEVARRRADALEAERRLREARIQTEQNGVSERNAAKAGE